MSFMFGRRVWSVAVEGVLVPISSGQDCRS